MSARRTGPAGPDDVDDRTLLGRHVAGDPEAFGELVGRHRDRLWAVALRTMHDREEAADALQDALVSAFRRAEGYRGDAAVTTWLHRIVVNACLDRIRRHSARRTEPLPEHDTQLPPGAVLGEHSAAGVESLAEQTARRDAVLDALRRLPAEQRAALVLVDMEAYSVDEAAELLDCAAGTVKSRCSRGRARLLPLLGDWAPRGSPGEHESGAVTEPLPRRVRPTRAGRPRPPDHPEPPSARPR